MRSVQKVVDPAGYSLHFAQHPLWSNDLDPLVEEVGETVEAERTTHNCTIQDVVGTIRTKGTDFGLEYGVTCLVEREPTSGVLVVFDGSGGNGAEEARIETRVVGEGDLLREARDQKSQSGCPSRICHSCDVKVQRETEQNDLALKPKALRKAPRQMLPTFGSIWHHLASTGLRLAPLRWLAATWPNDTN